MRHVDVEPRADKTLGMLRLQWLNCTKCVLGEQRDAAGGKQVFGEGARGGIMFIAGGPGETEEIQGRPFVGSSGRKVLRPIIEALGIEDVSYITNLVVCRSCVQQYDNAGQPLFERSRTGKPSIPLWKDEDPPQPCIMTCLPRLFEEIYLVDPIIIVAMGAATAETLLDRPIAITRERGMVEEISIPGASFDAVLTEKRQVWVRGMDPTGKMITPTERAKVRYLFVPTLHPAYVARNLGDERPAPEGPFQCIALDIRTAAKMYERYQLETRGIQPGGASDVTLAYRDEQEEEGEG